MSHAETVAQARLVPTAAPPDGPPDEHELYRVRSRHGNPYVITDQRVRGIVGPERGPDSMALEDIESLSVRKGLLHQDSYWTVRFGSRTPTAHDDPLMFFKTRSGAEDMVRQIERARALAPATPTADPATHERSHP